MHPGLDDRISGIPAPLGWFVGLLPGPREWLLVALVVVALYGRSETARRGFARVVRPWTTRPGKSGVSTGEARPAWFEDRWFILLAALASSAVAAWVVSWMILVHRRP